ncbi:DUF3800 domain-containing protein [Sphingomonas sp. KRR8]|uniref:DUF3800 domain-containing protein n=1 Tax=Sphingomonas sp. KRR8 TaxID=2942996 RepID=UPI00202137C7|nr:DUF3800 domain-containing protein [Sphingomonas sp. KRR8]URD60435.1 DUF3800 domain-containing protein [Sphingomonas sp. KRR8]
MRLIYFDEVKYHPPKQMNHWIGALSIDSSAVPELEKQVNEIAKGFFGNSALSKETEFHAVDMIHGKAQFKGRELLERLSALQQLLAIANCEGVRRISIRVTPANMVAPARTASEKAFVFLVERAQLDLIKSGGQGILIGDLDAEYADQGVTNLSRYREKGTPYSFGMSIDRLIDSVYFIPSHHSRMIQLADAYAYALQLWHSPPEGDTYPKKTIRKFIAEHTQLSWANSRKDWPSNDSWAVTNFAA